MVTTVEIKSELHRIIDSISDVSILQAIRVLLAKSAIDMVELDFWDELPESVQQDLDISIKQADKGELHSHEEVMQRIKTKFFKRNGN